MNIREEAALIRARQEQQKNSPEDSANRGFALRITNSTKAASHLRFASFRTT
jgi:hypothetical protein